MKKLLLFGWVCLMMQNGNAQIIRTIRDESRKPEFLSVPADGKSLVTGAENEAMLWDTQTGQLLSKYVTEDPILALAFDATRQRIFAGLKSKAKLCLYSAFWSKGVEIANTHTGKIITIALSRDGKLMATGGSDKQIKLYSVQEEITEIASLTGHKDDVTAIAFSPDNQFLLTGGKDKEVKMWDINKRAELISFSLGDDVVSSVAFSPDGKFMAAGTRNKRMHMWRVEGGTTSVFSVKGMDGDIRRVAFTPDSRFLAVATSSNNYTIFSLMLNEIVFLPVGEGVGHTDQINDLAFSDDGKLFTASNDKTVKHWNWGFPILAFSQIAVKDKNGNHKIEGNEDVSIKFSVTNDGYGDALKVSMAVRDTNRVSGLSVDNRLDLGDIPAKTTKEFSIPVKSTNKLIDSIAAIQLGRPVSISYTPIDARDTVLMLSTLAIPDIKISPMLFADADTSKSLEFNEMASVTTQLTNQGSGKARNLKATVFTKNNTQSIFFDKEIFFGDIDSMSQKQIVIPVRSTKKAIDEKVELVVQLTDESGLYKIESKVVVPVRKYNATLKEEIKEFVESSINDWQKKGKYEKSEDYVKRVNETTRKKQIELFTQSAIDSLVKRNLDWRLATNEYDADNESFKISVPSFHPIYLKVPLAQAKQFDESFKRMKCDKLAYTVSGDRFAFSHLELKDSVVNSMPYVFDSKDLIAFSSTQLDLKFDDINVDIPQGGAAYTARNDRKVLSVGKSDVDIDIPVGKTKNPNVYALLIGNEDYSSYQSGLESEVNVDFAVNDARSMKEYLVKTYGVPEENVALKTNATLGQMKQAIVKLCKLAELSGGKAELIFYYSGHGLPDENTKEGYIMPVDISGMEIKSAIKLNDLYAQLNQWPTKKVSVILDACFSGGARNKSLVAMKGVKIKPKEEQVAGNTVVITSSSGEESSSVYREKQHGMFTYFLLQKLKETKGIISLKSLSEDVAEKVKFQSVLQNNKVQTPQVIASPDFGSKLAEIGFVSDQVK